MAYNLFPDIDKILNSELKLAKAGPPLAVERCDLVDVWRPYLVVRGLEDWISKEIIEEHFEETANGAKIESIEIHDCEAKIVFINSQSTH